MQTVLIDSIINLLDHFKSCGHCDSQVLAGILDPCILKRLTLLKQRDISIEEAICDGAELVKQITELTAPPSTDCQTPQPTGISNCNGVLKPPDDESCHGSDCAVSRKSLQEKDDELASIISVSTTSDVVEYASSGVSSDPFTLPNIVNSLINITDASDADKNDSSTEYAETASIKETSSDHDTSLNCDSVSLISVQEGYLSSSSDQNNAPLEQHHERSIDCKVVQESEKSSSQSQPPPLIGRHALRNAFLQNRNNPQSGTPSTSPSISNETKVYYRSAPASSASSSATDTAQEDIAYKLVTTADINGGKLWKKHVELQGKITRCYTVPTENQNYCLRVKLLNFNDSVGVTQVTLRGDLAGEYDRMNASNFISVKGMCEKRYAGKTKAECKQRSDSYELVVQSWSRLKEKENRSDNVQNSPTRSERRFGSNEPRNGSNEPRYGSNEPRNGSNEPRNGSNERTTRSSNESRSRSRESRSRSHELRYGADEPRFGSKDIRYKDSEPKLKVTIKNDKSRHAVRKEPENAELQINRNVRVKPPPLVPVENRSSTSIQYSPAIYLSDVQKYINSSVVIWGTLSNATSTSATLSKTGAKVFLRFNAEYKVESNQVIVEGTPFKDKNNQTTVTVQRIEDLNPKHMACLKFLAYSVPSPSGVKSVRKISDMPKIINGADLVDLPGKFVIMRAKLVNLQHGGKRNPSKGCVVCGDGTSVNFSCVPFVLRNIEVNLGDQVVLIGKVDQNNKRSASNGIPWITIDHLRVIPDKETDSVLGFTKSAIYEALKQIVLETLKNDDRSLDRDPWSFLNDSEL